METEEWTPLDDLTRAIFGDPFVDVATLHDKGAQPTSTTGTFTGPAVSSHTTDIGAGVDAAYNASKAFDLAADQRLVISGLFRYDSLQTKYDTNALFPGLTSIGSTRENIYTLSGSMGYLTGSTYLGAIVSGNWGRGNWTDNVAGGTTGFNMSGFTAQGFVGKQFTLFDSIVTNRGPLLPTKAPPKPIGGYTIKLDLVGRLVYGSEWVDGFTDSTGFIWGTERFRTWDAGGQAKLLATIPNGELTWTPYVAATLDQQFGFSHTLDVPAQPGQVADTIHYAGPQTFWGARVGVDARAAGGWDIGVQGFYQQSSEFQIAGAQAFVRYYFAPGIEPGQVIPTVLAPRVP